MNFHEKLEERFLSAKSWLRHYIPHFHRHHFCDDFSDQMHYITRVLPADVGEELHLMYLKAHEVFLSDHFAFAKEYKKLKHKMEILQLDISEHCHKKSSDFDKKIVSESMAELKKIKDEMMELMDDERDRYNKFKKEIDHDIHDKIQEYLKNHLELKPSKEFK